MIMSTPDRQLVQFEERLRAIITENDLAVNFSLVKDMCYVCFELYLQDDATHEIPILAEFEAG